MTTTASNLWRVLRRYYSFIGPGILVSVSYMDPGNYSTSVSSGATYEYSLLFIIFSANIFAIILQCLCIKLGTVTGLDLAEMCRMHLPYYINLPLYLFAEVAIIATDLAEVVGTAIALEILFGIPLIYGVLITILDVLIILLAYSKDGSMRRTRLFENLVSLLVIATCICFILELFECDFAPGSSFAILRGFLPSKQIFQEKDAIFLSCGIIGATVMPHSLYLGSALVQPRLKEFDIKHGFLKGEESVDKKDDVFEDGEDSENSGSLEISSENLNGGSIQASKSGSDLTSNQASTGAFNRANGNSKLSNTGLNQISTISNGSSLSFHENQAPSNRLLNFSDNRSLTRKYKPSFQAIDNCLAYSYTELVLSLLIIAVFVNSSILIVAGSTLYGKPDAEDADLLSIYEMLSFYISPFAGLLFALSMLFAGQSAGIVCTMSGQIVSEGFINWSFQPWIRRLITRTLAIIPVLLVITVLGREGVSKVMNSSQVVLSFILPIVSAPLIYFTCQKRYMTVYDDSPNDETSGLLAGEVKMHTYENGKFFRFTAITTWAIISFLNLYLLYAFAHGANI